ncbi:MAG: acetyl-CoA carboxylase biotin carboxyl carrier protein subunit [Chloroflexi bacterium]|nr:MAG: acetyl-CoA carboxylase biotin carboxyl carrier protein subunit [Chloroflexota bacterium]MBL1196686.1 acetyl-CoA carboxylase biotin carboxyl carrier protein subunit [Chloroflexota bacterium]NOH13979.1 acetyl-CoA carboxylase biotin carboxyl carrier protein subunit [Chloroflexota bacterium]
MPPKKFIVTVDGTEYQAEIKSIDREGIEVFLNGQQYKVSFAELEDQVKTPTPKSKPIALPDPVQPAVAVNPDQVTAPLPGDVIEIMIQAGDEIEVGQGVIVLESMKMKNLIRSSRAGKVKNVHVSPGQSVAYGDLLMEFE